MTHDGRAPPDDREVVIVKDAVPVGRQSLFWGAEMVEDRPDLPAHGGMSRTLNTFNETSTYGPLPDDTPLYVCGPPISRKAILNDDQSGFAISQRICQNLRFPRSEIQVPMDGGPGFPVDGLIGNTGPALLGG